VTTPGTDPAILRIYDNIQAIADTIRIGEVLMANMADLLARITDLQSGQTELLKDVRRLIEAGDTSGAISQLDQVITANEQLDTEVEAASPEPTEPAPEEPTA
jgi:hypothetical protein